MTRVNPVAFRHAASRFVTGVAVLTAPDDGDRLCGMTANSFVTVSLSPPTVLVAIRPGRMHRAIGVARRYAVNVLPEDGQGLSHYFAGRPDAAGDPGFHLAGGLPRLDGCVAFFACEVTRIVDVGDHSLFIAEVSACDHRDAPPLVFYSSRYHVGAGRPVEG